MTRRVVPSCRNRRSRHIRHLHRQGVTSLHRPKARKVQVEGPLSLPGSWDFSIAHPFDPLSAPGARLERIGKVLCFPCNLVAAELHDAHGVGRLIVVCQDVFGDPKITAATDSPHGETLFTRLFSACDLYVASTADSLA